MSRLHPIDQPQTRLRQLCGSEELFRDRYQVLQCLGRGGFGVTYLAKDLLLPSAPECVIKQLCPKTDNPQVLQRASERFEREAKTLGQLGSHAQIPQLLDYFEESGDFFLIQEYVRGCNLAKLVKTHGFVSEIGIKRFLAELLPVLEFIHRNRVIHRDIKPPNIIRCEDDGRLVLIDFGAVKEKIAAITSDFSQKAPTTQFVGTVGFAPPEQLALRPTYGSDLYALGMTCLYLMTGRTPMEFNVDPRTGEVQWQADVQVSQHFSRILDKMLKPAPRDRYHSAGEIRRALELEPYLDNLADCMNSKSRPSAESGEDGAESSYLTPIARTAKDIRSWRARLAARQQRDGWRARDVALNSSCCG